METCIGKISKCILFITNLLIFILGIALFGIGVWSLISEASSSSFEEFLKKAAYDIDTGAYIYLAVSFMIVLVSFFGCCGAIKENRCMLVTYFLFTLILFIVMIIGTITVNSVNLEESSLKNTTFPPNNVTYETMDIWDELQGEFKCCGLKDVNDWNNYKFNWTKPNIIIIMPNKPKGCCKYKRPKTKDEKVKEMGDKEKEICGKAKRDPKSETYFFEGCYSKFQNGVKHAKTVLITSASVVLIIMFMNLVFSFGMCLSV